MNESILLTYSKPLLRQAVFSFWQRSLGKICLFALAILVFMFVILVWERDLSWASGFIACALFVSLLFPLLVYVVHYRNAMTKLKAMGSSQAQLTLGEDNYTVSSSAGTSTLPWSSIKEIWKFKELWIILLSRAHFWTLPLQNLSSEDKAFIINQVQKAGGKVR